MQNLLEQNKSLEHELKARNTELENAVNEAAVVHQSMSLLHLDHEELSRSYANAIVDMKNSQKDLLITQEKVSFVILRDYVHLF